MRSPHRPFLALLSASLLSASCATTGQAAAGGAPAEAPAPAAAAPAPAAPAAATEGGTPSPADAPQAEPAAVDLAGAACQGVARYLNVQNASPRGLSPDGKQLLFTTSVSGQPQLWVAPVLKEGVVGAPKQLTFGNRVQFAEWSPDGRWIAYGADRNGNERTQFFLLSPDGTQERALTPADEHFRIFGGWSPKGDAIAFSSTERNGRDFDVYLLGVKPTGETAGTPRQVLEGAGTLSIESWRQDGGAVVLSRARGEADNDLLLLDLGTGKVETLFAPEKMSSYRSVEWTPDGKGFYLATNHERDVAGLAFYEVASKKLSFLESPKWDVEAVALSKDGRHLAWSVNEAGFSRLSLKDLKSGRTTQPKGLPAGVLTGMRWAEDAPRLAVGVTGPGLPGDAWVVDAAAGGAAVRVTESSLAGLSPAAFVSPEAVQFPSFDNETIFGLLYKPAAQAGAGGGGGSGGGKPPVVMMLHGGPTSQARPDFDAVVQYLMSRGYAVLDLNFRGSTGYGQRFTQLDNLRKRPDAVRDMEAAAKWLQARPDVDGQRLAAMGGSYGGYMTLAAVAQLPEYFDAGVDFVGVANWITGLEDAGPQLKNSDRIEYGDIDDPKEREFFKAISPLSFADRIRSPLLVVHGANDPRVPVAEADQIVRQVRAQKGDVEYLRFPDEGHGLAKLQNRVTAYQRIARFLDRTLGGGSGACAKK